MLRKPSIIIISLALLIAGCQARSQQEEKEKPQNKEEVMKIELKSSAFEDTGSIPVKYTCDDKDISPQLSWGNPPEGTKSWVLICDDPDAPMGVWVHWILYNIPPETTSLHEAIPGDMKLPNGAIHGRNDFGKFGYGGPCPPPGKPHRYFFKLYAVDYETKLAAGLSKAEVMAGIEGHILAEGQLMGTYGR